MRPPSGWLQYFAALAVSVWASGVAQRASLAEPPDLAVPVLAAVLGGVGFLALLAALLWFFVMRRRRAAAKESAWGFDSPHKASINHKARLPNPFDPSDACPHVMPLVTTRNCLSRPLIAICHLIAICQVACPTGCHSSAGMAATQLQFHVSACRLKTVLRCMRRR